MQAASVVPRPRVKFPNENFVYVAESGKDGKVFNLYGWTAASAVNLPYTYTDKQTRRLQLYIVKELPSGRILYRRCSKRESIVNVKDLRTNKYFNIIHQHLRPSWAVKIPTPDDFSQPDEWVTVEDEGACEGRLC
eukprot:4683970-Prymnesium_polylepis.2